MKHIIDQALKLVKPQFRLDLRHGIHGLAHWSRVWMHGRFLCNELNLDPTVPCWFAFMHDSQRFDDGRDLHHGARACEWIDRLIFDGHMKISLEDRKLLLDAIEGHSHGGTEAHPIVQVCWDSDRLDLGRCGTMPLAQYLCTEPAKRPEVIQRAWEISQRFPVR